MYSLIYSSHGVFTVVLLLLSVNRLVSPDRQSIKVYGRTNENKVIFLTTDCQFFWLLQFNSSDINLVVNNSMFVTFIVFSFQVISYYFLVN